MKTHTQVLIVTHHSGFGMYQRGELQISPQNSYADKGDLLHEIGEQLDRVMPLAHALEEADFISAGIKDIRGRIYNEPGSIYAAFELDGEVVYFGVESSEVAEDFYD